MYLERWWHLRTVAPSDKRIPRKQDLYELSRSLRKRGANHNGIRTRFDDAENVYNTIYSATASRMYRMKTTVLNR